MQETAGNINLIFTGVLAQAEQTELNRTKDLTRNEEKTRAKIQIELMWKWGTGEWKRTEQARTRLGMRVKAG